MKISIKKPDDVTVCIEEGQKVDLHTPYYDKNTIEPVKIPLASILRFPPDKIFMALHKLVGESVHKGDILADYKGMFGIREYISEHTGTIAEINHYDGSITIHVRSDTTNTLNCYFVGQVDEISGNTIILKVKEGKEYSVDQVSHYFGGPVFYYNEQTKSNVSEDTAEHAIVIAESIPSYDQVKMEALGVRAFVTIHGLPEKTKLPTGRFSSVPDYKQVIKEAYPYCVIGEDTSTITFYK